MAQQLQSITITAPGFAGINTQDAPLAQEPSFAAVADNCVIDKEGRIAARKGYSMVSTNGAAVLGSSDGIELTGHLGLGDLDTFVFCPCSHKCGDGVSKVFRPLDIGSSVKANAFKGVFYCHLTSFRIFVFQGVCLTEVNQ